MFEKDCGVTRRDFLKGATLAALAAGMGLPAEIMADPPVKKMSRVVLVRHRDVFGADGNPDAKIINAMLEDGMRTLFDKQDAAESWKILFGPGDIVGIKSNVWGPLPTPAAVENAIRGGLITAGVNEKNIDIDDRGILDNDIFKRASGFVNVRPMRTHHWAGVGGCLKNPITFTPTPWQYHDNSCSDLALVWKLPACKDKIRLNILVMLTPLFHGIGAHHFDTKYTWKYNGLLLSTDPVAVDSTGLAIINARRKQYFGDERALTPPAHHIVFAETRHQLGIADPNKIELIKMGWQEGILI